MKEPEKIPLNPSTPRSKSVQKFPLNKIYPENIKDNLYRPDNDSAYIPIKNEDTQKISKT